MSEIKPSFTRGFRAARATLGSLAEATDAKRRTVARDVRDGGGYFVGDAILEA